MAIKLHLGCGSRNFGSDWDHIDGGYFEHLVGNNIVDLSQYDDDSVSLIYASHVLEYFDREYAQEVLGEWYRVLKRNGCLRVAVPDFRAMAKLYVDGIYPLESFLGPIFGKMKMGENTIYHKTTYDEISLINTMKIAGFKSFKRYDWRETEHAKFDDHSQAYLPHMDKENGTLISLNMEFYK